jgi:ABC-type lipoprotein export system ATPase subunit
LDGGSAAHLRSCFGGKQMVAQLSQTMSFVLDATAEELIALHAESRGAKPSVVGETLAAANELCGEPFSGRTPLTNLSGGQTRALMVADTALLCRSPIVLIDELENAGIDRRRAFDLLIANNKVVLLATHDPLLALLAERRISMNNGAVNALRYRTEAELEVLSTLEKMDTVFGRVRERLRRGEDISLK